MGFTVTVGGKGLGSAAIVQVPFLLVACGKDKVSGIKEVHLLSPRHQNRLNDGNTEQLSTPHNSTVNGIRAFSKGRDCFQQTLVLSKERLQTLHNILWNEGRQLCSNFYTNIVMNSPYIFHKGTSRRTCRAAINAFLQLVGDTSHCRNNNTNAVCLRAGNHNVR